MIAVLLAARAATPTVLDGPREPFDATVLDEAALVCAGVEALTLDLHVQADGTFETDAARRSGNCIAHAARKRLEFEPLPPDAGTTHFRLTWTARTGLGSRGTGMAAVPAVIEPGQMQVDTGLTGNVGLYELDVNGRLPDYEVSSVVYAAQNPIEKCYRRFLVGKPGRSGEMRVEIEILPDGKVESANVAKSELADPALEACVTSELGSLTFPVTEPPGRTSVVQTVTFSI